MKDDSKQLTKFVPKLPCLAIMKDNLHTTTQNILRVSFWTSEAFGPAARLAYSWQSSRPINRLD
jgi:hypothetical protein